MKHQCFNQLRLLQVCRIYNEQHIPLIKNKKVEQCACCFMLTSCLTHSSTLKMEVTCFSDTSTDFQWTTWHYIQGDRTFQ
jgi:hypothetical protein